MKTTSKRIASLIALLLALVTTGLAQEPNVVTAQVDRNSITTNESLILSITVVDTSNSAAPQLPPLNGFQIIGSSSSSQISIINGDINSQTVYSYRLRPTKTGELTIPAFGMTINGQTYSTDPIAIQVSPGNGAPAQQPSDNSGQTAQPSAELKGQDYFVEAEVSNPTPYVGEQITYTFRFYQGASDFFAEQPHLSPPDFSGFWAEKQSDQSQYRAQAAGQSYNVTELKTALFPSSAGPITIEAAKLTIPGGFFNRGVALQTKPIEVNAQPLPPNAPPNFTGAVGQYSISAEVDATEGKVNEPVTWRVTLSGRGNINAAPDPEWPEISGWRDFDSQATINTQVQDGVMEGSKVYERLLLPTRSGQFTIPALEYTYFDPETGAYQNAATAPIPVSIAQGDAEAPLPPPSPAGAEAGQVENIATDIRHLKPVPDHLNAQTRPLTASPLYWMAWGAPLVALGAGIFWQRRQTYRAQNAHLARSSKARKKARQALAQAKKQLEGYSAIAQILNNYLADKLNQPVAGLTHQSRADLLAEKGVPADLIAALDNAYLNAEMGRYAPDAGDPLRGQNLLTEIDKLIENLEKVL
ncbi:MAG TPA: hypothetical protein G4N96_08565 [Chloroflexi bacterium]|nr:hypothetical protein [Chloroflexota bacterium]